MLGESGVMGGSLRSSASLTQGSVVMPATAAVTFFALSWAVVGGRNSHMYCTWGKWIGHLGGLKMLRGLLQ